MFNIAWAIVRTFVTSLRSRRDLLLENLALRQQLAAFRARGKRLRIRATDRAFWVVLRRFGSRWTDALVIVKPHTVVRWHRAGFRLYWRWISRRRGRDGRRPVRSEIRDLIRQMAFENGWGAPRIHGELRMLGFDVSERTVYRSPWQNGTAERWVGACRQELLDHAIVLGEAHLRRVLREYVAYHHEDRTHCGLGKQTPMHRTVQAKSSAGAKVIALPRLGGLHHRYEWRDAA